MFNNLIESSSHRKEFKRRGSFFLFTVCTYCLLFLITGVASIYAYDANLGTQSYEITWLPPVSYQEPAETPRDTSTPQAASGNNRTSEIAQREDPMLRADDPSLVPPDVSSKPSTNPPIPKGNWTIGPNRDPIGGNSAGPGIPGNGFVKPSGPVFVDAGDPPPPAATTPPKPKTITASRVLNSQALSLPKPTYSILARQARVQGTVTVQVLIDETGRVVSATVLKGHPLLVPESQRAALQARFSPTMVGDQPVKVSGMITYNFVMQ